MQEEKNGGNADSSRKEEKAAKREEPMKNENKQIKKWHREDKIIFRKKKKRQEKLQICMKSRRKKMIRNADFLVGQKTRANSKNWSLHHVPIIKYPYFRLKRTSKGVYWTLIVKLQISFTMVTGCLHLSSSKWKLIFILPISKKKRKRVCEGHKEKWLFYG